jgi:hypothetical protein
MDLSGLYWTPPGELDLNDVHKNLAGAINGRNSDSVKVFSASAFEIPSAFPAGYFDVAVDTVAQEACGVYRISYDRKDYATRPKWFSCKEMDIDEVFASIYGCLEKLGVIRWYRHGGSPDEFMDYDAPSASSYVGNHNGLAGRDIAAAE